jgi:hypothetical protein
VAERESIAETTVKDQRRFAKAFKDVGLDVAHAAGTTLDKREELRDFVKLVKNPDTRDLAKSLGERAIAGEAVSARPRRRRDEAPRRKPAPGEDERRGVYGSDAALR